MNAFSKVDQQEKILEIKEKIENEVLNEFLPSDKRIISTLREEIGKMREIISTLREEIGKMREIEKKDETTDEKIELFCELRDKFSKENAGLREWN